MKKNKLCMLGAACLLFFSQPLWAQAPLPPNQDSPISGGIKSIENESQASIKQAESGASDQQNSQDAVRKELYNRSNDFKRYYTKEDSEKWDGALNEAAEKLALLYRQWQSGALDSNSADKWIFVMFERVDRKSGDLIDKNQDIGDRELLNWEKLWLKEILSEKINSLAFDGDAYYVIMQNIDEDGFWLAMPLANCDFVMELADDGVEGQGSMADAAGQDTVEATSSTNIDTAELTRQNSETVQRYEMMQKAWQVKHDDDRPRRSGR